MHNTDCPPNLEARFCPPEGWRWHSFKRKGRQIRFGTASPKNSVPDAVVVCLQGAREFSEKYFEIANWCIDNNLAFWTCDWAGQGLSTRLIDTNPQKRHSTGFADDVEDLRYFILEYIKHSSVHPDKGRIPMAMLGHSAGAHIGLRYLLEYPDGFECACFSSPLIGLKSFEKVPQILAYAATFLCNEAFSLSYAPKGNDWDKRKESVRKTSDPVRGAVEKAWCEHQPALQCGDVTYGWVHEAQSSCMHLQSALKKETVNTPCLFSISEQDDLIDNKLTQNVFSHVKDSRIVEYSDSFHETLMEKDHIRDDFLGHFYNLIKETIIERPETLKPF